MSCILANRTGSSKPVFWSTSSDAEIVQALEDAYAGKIDLEEDYGWCVGQERTVHLSAMSASYVGESYGQQDARLVLMHRRGYTLASGQSCQFIVGLVDTLGYFSSSGYMNSTASNSGSWGDSARRS